MVKDDFFVIAYRMLSYLYACMKAGETPDVSELSYERFKIQEKYLEDIVMMLFRSGYMEGDFCDGGKLSITMRGIEFIQFNYLMENAKNFLKTSKEFVPKLW